ncbi:hypothetical protein MMP74_16545, partial [Acinetobacter sp. NIPH 1869]|nr:hypothetical protein [Acinetobacter higginsii]
IYGIRSPTYPSYALNLAQLGALCISNLCATKPFHRFTNMSALLYTGSVMVFLMGLISEQITALMYKEK